MIILSLSFYMVHITRFIKLLLAFICIAVPAHAADPLSDLDFKGRYDFNFSGIPFGQLDIALNQKATNYSVQGDISMVGIAKLFVQHSSHTTSNGSGANFQYDDVSYESSYQTRKKPKYVKWVKKGGLFISEIVKPPDNRATRPAVPDELKIPAVDPLALAVVLRARLAEAMEKGETDFELSMYDGRRLTYLYFTVKGEKTIRIKEIRYPVYHVTAKRKAVEGYTKKELADIAPNEPPLNIYFSHDKQFIPIRLDVPMLFGIASATLRM